MTKKLLKIPFKNNIFQTYPHDDNIDWKDNFEFQDVLYTCAIHRGNSSAHIIVQSKVNQKQYAMFLIDLLEALQSTTIINGEISGLFTFVKRGQNYGIKLVKS